MHLGHGWDAVPREAIFRLANQNKIGKQAGIVMDTQPPNPSLSRKEARDRLRRAAAHSDQAGADWIEQHPYESLSFALMIGWLLARYPRIGRTLIRLLAR